MKIEVDRPARIDKLLADTLPQFSRSALAKLFAEQLVLLNGESVRPGHKVRPGDVIDADTSPLDREPDVIDLPILYEDDDVIVIDKPTGIISHARGRFWQEASVASFVRRHNLKNPEAETVVEKIESTEVVSYVMGCRPEIREELGKLTDNLIEDGENFFVTFDSSKLETFCELMNEYLKPGFWTEYISVSGVGFIIKTEDGIANQYVVDVRNTVDILNICRRLAKTNFVSLKSMLFGNEFYAKNELSLAVLSALDAQLISRGATSERTGIVHRLDRATSGVMICAKNQSALSFLQKQFHDRHISKTYLAVTNQEPKNESATIDAPIARDPNEPKRFGVFAGGKTAQTDYEVIGRKPNKYLIRLHPHTGRTHQLRVHLKFIDCPIMGDALYGGKKADRLYLHAYQLSVNLPNGNRVTFMSPLPEGFYGAAK